MNLINEKFDERTFIMIKPDGVKRRLVGEIIKRLERKGFQMTVINLIKPKKEILEKHYSDLKKKDFYSELINFMLSGSVVTMVWEGRGIVDYTRKMLGETDPLKSMPGTIRGDFATDINQNICHASDGKEVAEKEIELWFGKEKKIDC